MDYACLNVNDAPQQVTAQSGCYEVKVGWYIEGTGVAPVTEGGVRWQIEKWEGSVADREVGVGIVPYSQDRVTSCTVQTLTGNGFLSVPTELRKRVPPHDERWWVRSDLLSIETGQCKTGGVQGSLLLCYR